MESTDHRSLKWLAARWLIARGGTAVATEVLCPIARFRVDAAGWGRFIPPPETLADSTAKHESSIKYPERSIIIECKQARADFLTDRADTQRLLRKREHLERCRAEFEDAILRPSEPHLRESGSSLFPGMEAWDFAASRSPHYRRILALLAAIDRRLHGHTKYSTMARYRLADRLYLLTPRGLITPAEAPASWGVLEVEPEPLREVGRLLSPGRGARTDRKAALLHLETDPDWWLGFRVRVRMDDPLEARPERRAALLRNIAAANTRRQYGRSVPPERTLFGAPPALPAPLL